MGIESGKIHPRLSTARLVKKLNCLIGAIIKDQNWAVIPFGNTILEPDDQVIIVTIPENASKIGEMLEGGPVRTNHIMEE